MQIALGASAIALLIGWYTTTNLESAASFAYFQHLDDFRAVEAQEVGNATRVHGYVALGSIQRDVASKQVHFAIVNDPPHAGGGARCARRRAGRRARGAARRRSRPGGRQRVARACGCCSAAGSGPGSCSASASRRPRSACFRARSWPAGSWDRSSPA